MLVVRQVVNYLFVCVILVSKETDTTVQVGFIKSCDLANIPHPKRDGNEIILSCFSLVH